MSQSVNILFPPGRLIMGDVYKGSDKDDKGQPRLVKSGPNKGQPFTQYFIGVAIPKNGEANWWDTPWGQQILAVGQQAFPNIYSNPTFAWKIDNGDSTVPNKKGRKPCDMEGAKGHWIVKFSSGFAPKVYSQPSAGTFVEDSTGSLIKPGYWVQINGTVSGNGSSESPGVYIGHSMALFVRQDTVISQGPDAATAFAGAAVSQMPAGGAPMPGMPGMPGALPTAATAAPIPTPTPGVSMPAPTMVVPNAGFLQPPGAAAAPAMPGAAPAAGVPMAAPVPAAPAPLPAPAAPVGPVLTPAGVATGYTLEQYRAGGWTDDQLRAQGYIA